jgi:hypothetical protein
MTVIRWSVGLAAVLFATTAVVAAPAALAAGGVEAIGLAEQGSQIVSFRTSAPDEVKEIGTVRGLDGGTLIGIDFRPEDHRLYGVSNGGGIYTIDTSTAKATEVGKLSVAVHGRYWDIDFTPSGDALRIVTDRGQNLRQAFGPDGPTGPTVEDPSLSRGHIAALGYTGSGRALGIDSANDQVVQVDGGTGKVTGLGAKNAFPEISTASNGLDVVGTDAFATVNLDHRHTLFSVDTRSGAVTEMGVFNPQGGGAEGFRHVIDLTIRR